MSNIQQDPYQEYSDLIAEENGDYYNTEKFRQLLSQSKPFIIPDRLKNYEQKLLQHALKNTKSKKEWQDLEAEDIRHKAFGAMPHLCAGELEERYKAKIQHSYRAEEYHKKQLDECDKKIAVLEKCPDFCKHKANSLKHWKERRIHFDMQYALYAKKSNRFEKLTNKWKNVCWQIEQADIAKEIEAEKRGIGNKYGYNPFMRSRETATDIFED